MPVLCSTNPFAGTGAPNHPHHLAIHGLGPRHGRKPQKGPGRLHSPTRSSRQVHQLDRGQAHHQHPLRKRQSNSSSTSSTGLAFPTTSSLTTGLTSSGRSSWTSVMDMASESIGPRSDTHVLMVRSSVPMAWSSKDSSHTPLTDSTSTLDDGF